MIHVAFIDSKSELGIEYHIILKNNDSGIYSYVKAWNNTDHPLKVNELRTVYRFNQGLFNWSTNGVRFGRQPSSKEMLRGKKFQDETFQTVRFIPNMIMLVTIKIQISGDKQEIILVHG